MDAVPVASQVKSFVQWAAGDDEGAKQTQENFSKQCIVVSQARSLVEFASGDSKAARETQKQFASCLGSTVNALPVVGHVKGAVHYATGDKEKGHAAMKAASRSTGVAAGGAVGFFTAGPPGAVAGGVAAGVTMDSVITAADSAKHKEFRPHGGLQIVSDPKNAGKWVDLVGGYALDGVAGYSAGNIAGQVAPVIDARIDYQINPTPDAPKPVWKAETVAAVSELVVPETPSDAVLSIASADEVNDTEQKPKGVSALCSAGSQILGPAMFGTTDLDLSNVSANEDDKKAEDIVQPKSVSELFGPGSQILGPAIFGATNPDLSDEKVDKKEGNNVQPKTVSALFEAGSKFLAPGIIGVNDPDLSKGHKKQRNDTHQNTGLIPVGYHILAPVIFVLLILIFQAFYRLFW